MKASIVVCTYGLSRVESAALAVSSLTAQTVRSHEIVVVADAANEQRALRAVLPTEARVLINPIPGNQASARNSGIEAATGELVGFLDDDAIADPHWLERLINHFRDDRVVAVGGKAVPSWEDGERPPWLPEELDWIVGGTYRGYADSTRTVRNVHGHNMIFRRAVLQLVGGFRLGRTGGDPITCDGDETELCLRIRQLQPEALIVYEPRAVIHHKVPPSKTGLGYLIRKSFGQGRGKAMIRMMHYSSPVVLSTEFDYLHNLAFEFYPAVLRRMISGDIKGPLAQALAVLLSSLSTLCGYFISRVQFALGAHHLGRDTAPDSNAPRGP